MVATSLRYAFATPTSHLKLPADVGMTPAGSPSSSSGRLPSQKKLAFKVLSDPAPGGAALSVSRRLVAAAIGPAGQPIAVSFVIAASNFAVAEVFDGPSSQFASALLNPFWAPDLNACPASVT